jgi:predicted membrane protein
MSEPRTPRVFGGVILPMRRTSARLIFGLLVIGLGVLFMLDNLGVVDSGEVLRWWPTALIAYGVTRLFGYGSRTNLTTALLFITGGSWMLLHNLGILRFGIGALWPLMLVLVGFAMVSGARRRAAGGPATPEASGELNAFAFWSGSERRIVSQEFRGGDVTAIMGGHEIDLRQARSPDGTAVIDLLVWMGGVNITVPEDCRVVLDATAIMGGVQDQTRSTGVEKRQTLILRGLILMGGVEIKN